MEDKEDILEKQKYLRTEILDQGFDPQEFNDFMCESRKVESIDLESWTLQEIMDVVKSFKENHENNENKDNKENQENEEIQLNEDNNNINEVNEEEKEKEEIEIKPKINANANTNLKQSISSTESQASITNNPFDYYQKTIRCERLEPNDITNREDLYITLSDPERIKPGFFSSAYYQYTVKTFPLNFIVVRKVSDFTFLSQKLPLIHPVVYTPELPSFSFGVKDDSEEKIKFFQNYMNLLIENKFFRSLPIVYDFITLPQNDWNNKVKNKYSKIKLVEQFNAMPNFEGKHVIKITQEDEQNASAIKNDIAFKNEIYNDIDLNLDELLINYDKICFNMKNIAVGFNQLRKKYKNNVISKGYGFLASLFKTWCEDYILQKNIIRDEIKYFFLFFSKELNTFLRNFDEYKLARNDYKNTYDKYKKSKNPTKELFDLLKSTKKYYAFELTQVNSEYTKLEERQGKRLLNQFAKYNDNVNILFQDFKKCCMINKIIDRIKKETNINEKENEKSENNIINNDVKNKEEDEKINENNINEAENKNEINIEDNNQIKVDNNIEDKNEQMNKIESNVGDKNDEKNENKNIEEGKNEEIKIEENNKAEEAKKNNIEIEDKDEKRQNNEEEKEENIKKDEDIDSKEKDEIKNNEIKDEEKKEKKIIMEDNENKNEANDKEKEKENKEVEEIIKENKNEILEKKEEENKEVKNEDENKEDKKVEEKKEDKKEEEKNEDKKEENAQKDIINNEQNEKKNEQNEENKDIHNNENK